MLGEGDPATLRCQRSYGALLLQCSAHCPGGRNEEMLRFAQKLLTQAHAAQVTALGVGHKDTLETSSTLADAAKELGQYQAAVDLQRAALDGKRALHGKNHSLTLQASAALAALLLSGGWVEEAEPMLIESEAWMTRVHGPMHPSVLRAAQRSAAAVQLARGAGEALPLLEQCLVGWRVAQGQGPRELGVALNRLAGAYADVGNLGAAQSLVREALVLAEEVGDTEGVEAFSLRLVHLLPLGHEQRTVLLKRCTLQRLVHAHALVEVGSRQALPVGGVECDGCFVPFLGQRFHRCEVCKFGRCMQCNDLAAQVATENGGAVGAPAFGLHSR